MGKVDINDANTWTKAFAATHRSECIRSLWETNELCIRYIRQEEEQSLKAALWGLNMLMNGLTVMQDAKCGSFRSYLFGFSMVAGEIILCCDVGVSEHKRRELAIDAFLDARDFATSEQAKRNMNAVVSAIKKGRSLSELQADFNVDEVIGHLQDMGSRLKHE